MKKPIFAITVLAIVAVYISGCTPLKADKPQEKSDEQIPHSEETSEKLIDEQHLEKTWLRTYGTNVSDTVNDVLPAKDGGYYLLGATNVIWEPEREADIYLIKTDVNGEVSWEKTYPGDPLKAGSSMIYSADGNIIIAGQALLDDSTGFDIFLLKVDLKGNEIEFKTFASNQDEWVATIQQTADGGYILFGNSVDPDDYVTNPGTAGYGGFENRSSLLAIRLDQSWDVVWNNTYDNNKNTLGIGGVQTAKGDSYLVSSIINFPDLDDDVYVIKVDSEGNQIWSQTIEEYRSNARDFLVTSDGNLLIGAMYSESGDPREGDADILLIEMDKDGNEIGVTILGEPNVIDMLSGLIETKDEGYLIVADRTPNLYNSASG